MAKTNISFNNKNYQIDDTSLSSATSALHQHLSTVMNGTGATINFGGVPYNIDSTKLATTTNAFVSHLGTIAGNGHKVMVNGVEYGIDSAKVQGAISELEATFGGNPAPDVPTEERLEGDGAEYYTLAPTALSFRSTAPLNELQEVQINGVTVDPSNYTLEEGSTIVTFPIEYLKTLDVGNYEVDVVSDSKTVKGGFKVAAPELNAHGFYYNQPYSANLPMFGGDTAFFVREDGTYDIITVGKIPDTGEYTMNGNNIVATHPILGTITCTISSDGTEVFCNELQVAFKLSNSTAIAADDDYVYIYMEDLGGYEVKCIDKTKTEYGAIKTGINGIDTVKLADEMFGGNHNLVTAPKMPDSITTIGEYAFRNCSALTEVVIGDGVTTIGANVFYDCHSLTYIVIPASVENISYNAFIYCENIASVQITDIASWCNINFSHVVSNPFRGNSKATLYLKGEALVDLTIPDGITNINSYAFCGCNTIASVMIPNSITSIGMDAFGYCDNLATITFEGTVAQWNAIAFNGGAFGNCPATYVQCSDGQVAL